MGYTDDANDDADDEQDLDYNGTSSSGSDSIDIKIGSNNVSWKRKLADNGETKKSTNDQPITATTEPNIAITNSLPSPATISNYNYNNENYYSKDDMSVYDDVNNNRLNLRSNKLRSNGANAYEQRNIYVANNALSDNSSSANDSFKSYIHIEVFKGNLDEAIAAKPKEAKSIKAVNAKANNKSPPRNGNILDRLTSTAKP